MCGVAALLGWALLGAGFLLMAGRVVRGDCPTAVVVKLLDREDFDLRLSHRAGGRARRDSAWRLARVAKVGIRCVHSLWTMPRRRCGYRSGHARESAVYARWFVSPSGRAITPTHVQGRSSVVVPGCGLDWLGCERRCGDALVVTRMTRAVAPAASASPSARNKGAQHGSPDAFDRSSSLILAAAMATKRALACGEGTGSSNRSACLEAAMPLGTAN